MRSAGQPVAGRVTNTNDCNDGDATVKPGAPERCNGADDDCDGTIDDVAVSCGTAGTRTWTGTISTDWNTPCNWSPACLPTAADNVARPIPFQL